MQKNIKVLLLATGLLTLSACESFLDKNNPTATTDDKWWNLETDLKGALETLYAEIPSGALAQTAVGGVTPVFANARAHMVGTTDEAVFRANYSDWQVYPLGQANSSTGSAREIYESNYRCIRNASRFLENYEKAYLDDPALKKQYAAEARALRAFYHMNLFMIYGPVPIVDHTITPAEQQLVRNTREELVSFVISELDKAAGDLPASYSINDAFRISKGTCYALQSILYLFIGDYENTIAASKKVMDLNVYDLHVSANASENSYASLFSYSGLINKERILFRRKGMWRAFFRLGPKSFAGQATTSPTGSLVNTYETLQGKTIQELGADSLEIYTRNPLYNNNRDPRMTAAILFPGQTFIGRKMDPFDASNPDLVGSVMSTQTGFWYKKYLDPLDVSKISSGGDLDFAVIRYAEILLNYVEALIESGSWQHPDVALYLNKIRQRAGMPDIDSEKYNTQSRMRELLRRERQVELALEGQRFFDIRRWKIGEQVLDGTVYGAYNPLTQEFHVSEQRKFDPARDYLWPIPLVEINVNSKMEQNPGW